MILEDREEEMGLSSLMSVCETTFTTAHTETDMTKKAMSRQPW